MKYRIGHSVGVYKVDMSVLRVGDVIDDRDNLVEFELLKKNPDETSEVRVVYSDNSRYNSGRILTWDGKVFVGESKNTLSVNLMKKIKC